MFDIHTHNKQLIHKSEAIVNCNVDDDFSLFPFFSLGLHPWDVDEGWEKKYVRVEETLRRISDDELLPQLVAIGEIGLDKARGGEMKYQQECFRKMLCLAQNYSKPVILHCVKAVDEVLAALKQVDFSSPVVFHGFRGKPEQARQLIDNGYYLSFGAKFNEEALKLAYTHERMFLETDDSGLSLNEIYESAGRALNISPTDIDVPGIFAS